MSDERAPIMTINVGGVLYQTLRATLARHRGSALAQLSDDEDGVFVDRDPYLFAYVLGWLRSGHLYIYPDATLLEALRVEAQHFGLPSLSEELERCATLLSIQQHTKKSTARGPPTSSARSSSVSYS